MSGFVGVIGDRQGEVHGLDVLKESINLSGGFVERHAVGSEYMFVVTFLAGCPLRERRLFENDAWIVAFAGDMIDYEAVPCDEIIRSVTGGAPDFLASLNGIFAIIVFDKRRRVVYVVSDRRSQQPVYYHIGNGAICISSDLSTFCRLPSGVSFNERWLWECLYFNFPVNGTTFLKGETRMPPASLLQYDVSTRRCTIRQYANAFRKKDVLLEGQEALDLALSVLSARIPKYFRGAEEVACAVTSGWDGRTLLAFAPSNNVTAYTYGVEGCRDLQTAAEVAKRKNCQHAMIAFGDAFERDLSRLIMETVYLSSGLQHILRSTLVYVYSHLTDFGRKFPVTISGICLGNEFRGATSVPWLISNALAELFLGGAETVDKQHWSEVLGHDYMRFEEHVAGQMSSLRAAYGDFRTGEHHLSNVVYWLGPQHYSGEMKISGHFTTVRVPGWDNDIIDLAYSIKMSTLSFSPFLRGMKEPGDDSIRMQSYILSRQSPPLARVLVRNRRPDLFIANRPLFHLLRIYEGIKSRSRASLSAARRAPLENWPHWLNNISRGFIDRLVFSPDSRIRAYVNHDYLKRLQNERNVHVIGKLSTAEIVIRLVENNWRRFW